MVNIKVLLRIAIGALAVIIGIWLLLSAVGTGTQTCSTIVSSSGSPVGQSTCETTTSLATVLALGVLGVIFLLVGAIEIRTVTN